MANYRKPTPRIRKDGEVPDGSDYNNAPMRDNGLYRGSYGQPMPSPGYRPTPLTGNIYTTDHAIQNFRNSRPTPAQLYANPALYGADPGLLGPQVTQTGGPPGGSPGGLPGDAGALLPQGGPGGPPAGLPLAGGPPGEMAPQNPLAPRQELGRLAGLLGGLPTAQAPGMQGPTMGSASVGGQHNNPMAAQYGYVPNGQFGTVDPVMQNFGSNPFYRPPRTGGLL